MTPKKNIGELSDRNLWLVGKFIDELKPDEDLTIWVQNGVVRALKQKNGEKYSPMADNDFIFSYRFGSLNKTHLAEAKLVNEN